MSDSVVCLMLYNSRGSKKDGRELFTSMEASEIRRNSKYPWGLPLDNIPELSLFRILQTVEPGRMTTSVDISPVSDYITLINSENNITSVTDSIRRYLSRPENDHWKKWNIDPELVNNDYIREYFQKVSQEMRNDIIINITK